LQKEHFIENLIPAFIFFSLWLDGSFHPLLLLPFLYVVLVEKKDLSWLGFRNRETRLSVCLGLLTAILLMMIYYPIFLCYVASMEKRLISLYDIFTDVAWYPLYEEVAYRSFLLVHFGDFEASTFSRKNLLVNFVQSLLFVSIHKHHVVSGRPLVLITIFILGIVNGLVFLKTRNISGCILSHCAVNGFALFLRWVHI
jgi:membrane protease YdiL (CAAX protease family)